MSSPAALTGAGNAANATGAPATMLKKCLSKRWTMFAFLGPDKGTSKAFPLQYRN
jgi:hypothetical protein